MSHSSDPTPTGPATPFLISSDVGKAVQFYTTKLGFTLQYSTPEPEPFFAIVARGPAQIMLKTVGDVPPLPNPQRHPWARWDAFLFVADPKALAGEFIAAGTILRSPFGETEDGLLGFEVADADGYVLFFGRPLSATEEPAR